MRRSIFPSGIIKFILLLSITVILTYWAPVFIKSLWYLTILLLYYKSKDEAFWLAFFFATVDGFMGFLGIYSVTIQVLPGLPAIELAQFYVLLAFIKTIKRKTFYFTFYDRYLAVLSIYLIFLIFWGQLMGFSGELKDYFRILKLTFPFLLFFTLPRLLTTLESYERLFTFIFIILIAAFITQLTEVVTGLSPSQAITLTAEQMSEAGAYRGFYNIGATLLGFFGALFYLTSKSFNRFNIIFLFSVIVSSLGMAYLSATRGWILGFSIVIILILGHSLRVNSKRAASFVIFTFFIILLGLSNNNIRKQLYYSTERLKKLEAVASGDITAEGSLSRLDRRGPRVMKIFRESPLFGWGFSDTSRKYSDSHVGNQTLLLNSGIIGFCLLMGFLFFFGWKLLLLFYQRKIQFGMKSSLPVFFIFLIGWLIIHSTSGQHFNFMGIPAQIMPQAIFFSLGALIYYQAKISFKY